MKTQTAKALFKREPSTNHKLDPKYKLKNLQGILELGVNKGSKNQKLIRVGDVVTHMMLQTAQRQNPKCTFTLTSD